MLKHEAAHFVDKLEFHSTVVTQSTILGWHLLMARLPLFSLSVLRLAAWNIHAHADHILKVNRSICLSQRWLEGRYSWCPLSTSKRIPKSPQAFVRALRSFPPQALPYSPCPWLHLLISSYSWISKHISFLLLHCVLFLMLFLDLLFCSFL